MRTLLNCIAAGCLVTVGVSGFSIACAIRSYQAAMITYAEKIEWIAGSIAALVIAGIIILAIILKDETKKEKTE